MSSGTTEFGAAAGAWSSIPKARNASPNVERSQFGSPTELPRIKHLRANEKDAGALPDWRITCFFVDKEFRGRGVAEAALAGALHEIARLGGGTVESYPEDVEGRTVSASFLYNSRLFTFERHGFKRVRRLGKSHWVVSKEVEARRAEGEA